MESQSAGVREAPKVPPNETATVVPKMSEEEFFKAAYEGDAATVKRGIRQGIPVDARAENNATALMLASYNGYAGIVEYLIEHKATIDARDDSKQTALMYASSGDFAATVQLLIDAGANINAEGGHQGWTPIMWAAAEGQVEVVKVLLKHSATTTNRDADGDTALQFAVKNGHKEVAELLGKSEK